VQLTNLLQYQQMFSASAKVIGTAANMLNSLLAEVQ
jgi:flagellar hook-associated protein FlgK